MRTMYTNKGGIDLSVLAGLLTPSDCQTLINIGSQEMRDATVFEEATSKEALCKDRICQMAWPKRENHPILENISKGVAKITGIPQSHQEPAQILRYTTGGEYKPHFDAFDEQSAALKNGGNRQATLIIYLNTVALGGETALPELDLKVSAIAGCGLFFRSLDKTGKRLPFSLHAGLPVGRGEKWILTTWMREYPYV